MAGFTIRGGGVWGADSEACGGAILCDGVWARIENNIITDNSAGQPGSASGGGGIALIDASPLIFGNVISANTSLTDGGGIYCVGDSAPDIWENTITGNVADDWEQGAGGGIFTWGSVEVSNSIIRGNGDDDIHGTADVGYSNIGGGWPGEGNIDADPLFIDGFYGDFYLSQTAAGQKTDSPCVDAGDPVSELFEGTTRTDLVQDEDTLDMGYHYALDPGVRLVTGPGPAHENPPLVRTFMPLQDAARETEFTAYGIPWYGVNVSTGDVNGDGRAVILTGAGPGERYGPHVRGFELDGSAVPGLSFLAYGTLKWGVNVAAGDVDGDGFDEIITGAGPGAVFGPHVRGWNYDNTAITAMPEVSFLAYGTPKWGVNVACGDIDGDGFDEIVTGAGPGSVYGPHVRGWDYDGTAVAAMPDVSYLAYGTNRFGVRVACGDLDGDGIDEIVTTPGPGAVFGAHVRGWDYDGDAVAPLEGLDFMAWPYPGHSYGAQVFAGSDLDNDGRDDIVVGGGADPAIGTPVKVFRYDGSHSAFWFSLEAYEEMTHGATVAAGRF